MWVAKINTQDEPTGLKIKAPTLNSLYVKLYKILRMGVLEIHIYQED